MKYLFLEIITELGLLWALQFQLTQGGPWNDNWLDPVLQPGTAHSALRYKTPQGVSFSGLGVQKGGGHSTRGVIFCEFGESRNQIPKLWVRQTPRL